MAKPRRGSMVGQSHTLRETHKNRHNCDVPRYRQRIIRQLDDGWTVVEQETVPEPDPPAPPAPSLDVRAPRPGETYQEYLGSFGIRHFTAREVTLLRRWGVVREPMRATWAAMVPTLQLADMVREELGHPLAVGSGYRPTDYNSAVGGATNSQHLHNRAVDLDLPTGYTDTEHRVAFADAVGRLWHEYSGTLKMGMGVYEDNPRRIHIDTGYRARFWEREHAWPILERTKR